MLHQGNGNGGGLSSGNGMFGSGRGPEFPSWACSSGRMQKTSKVLRPTNVNMMDTEGRPIHAHGGGFVAPGQGGGPNKRWWWYGESAKNNPLNAGVNAYSSSDLATWKYEGSMISQKTILGKLRQLKSSSAFEVASAPPAAPPALPASPAPVVSSPAADDIAASAAAAAAAGAALPTAALPAAAAAAAAAAALPAAAIPVPAAAAAAAAVRRCEEPAFG